MQILTVDDDDFQIHSIQLALSQLGHTAVPARSGLEALNILRKEEIRLVITDWEMPGMDGLQLCRAVREEDFNGYVYIIMLTGHRADQSWREGMTAGADAFLNKPLDTDHLEVCLKTAERILSLETRDVTLFALAKLAESRDPEVGGHIERVQSYARLVAQHLKPEVKKAHGVDAEYIRLLYQTCPLHDLGKVSIPDHVLLKPGKLTREEFEIMKTHTTLGAQTLDAALQRFPNVRFLRMAKDIAESHQEKFNGLGYPGHLSGEQIPFCGRIVAIADVYDAMTSKRVYKEAMSHETARDLIVKERGRHFDPDVVDAFIGAEQQIISVRSQISAGPDPSDTPRRRVSDRGVVARPENAGILVVEDSPVFLRAIAGALRETGRPVLTASGTEEAMEIVARERPVLIVSDLEMPGPDGIELCNQVRALPCEVPTYFIMLTGCPDREMMLQAYKAGVNDFITKPFHADELLARVIAGLRTTRLHEQLAIRTSHLQAENSSLNLANDRLDQLSITDDLTGLFNRRHAMVRLEEQWSLAERYGRFLTVAVADIDFFKTVNDTWGHDAGDTVLREVARILKSNTRGTDAVCRIGGEEFLIIFPSETLQDALVCCERCRAEVEAFQHGLGDAKTSVTISIGVATRSEATPQFPDLLREADKALYFAKQAGRNRVCQAGEAAPTAVVVPLQQASDEPPIEVSLNWDRVLERAAGNTAFATSILQRYADLAPVELAKIDQSFTKSDFEALRRQIHSFKSMTAYISADTASSLCKQIEELLREGRTTEIAPLMPRLDQHARRAIEWVRGKISPELARSA
jgi:putative two-component system response regulator